MTESDEGEHQVGLQKWQNSLEKRRFPDEEVRRKVLENSSTTLVPAVETTSERRDVRWWNYTRSFKESHSPMCVYDPLNFHDTKIRESCVIKPTRPPLSVVAIYLQGEMKFRFHLNSLWDIAMWLDLIVKLCK
ncbi:uncharacterized protein LOC135167682 [Diachasmimorpha longicaudata]|uniref:uncharacterized protein LOC135167682 n=1 Tax=Diachasmimorpha longicaudata TaxID=58733 RepID=UPI0030B8EB07